MQKKLAILLIEDNIETIMQAFCDCFGLENNSHGTMIQAGNGKTNFRIDLVTKEMPVEPEDFFKRQIDGIWGHFHQVQTTHTDIKLHTLIQIRMSNAFIMIDCDFSEDAQNEEYLLFQQLSAVLSQFDGLLLAENGSRFFDKNLSLVLSDSGESELETFFPAERPLPPEMFQNADPESFDRRNRSLSILRKQGIYVTDWLPLIESEQAAHFQTLTEVAKRAGVLLAVALHAEVLMTEEMDVAKARAYSSSVLTAYECADALSPREKAFLENDAPTQQEAIHFSWQYECLFVMIWALGLTPELPFPDQICDVAGSVRIMNTYNTLEKLVSSANLRTPQELLDEADYIYRMDWACVDARVNRLPAPAKLDGGVVMERHKCLNWLIGSEEADWDNVDVST